MGAELISLFEESVIDVRHLDVGMRFTVGDSQRADLPWSGLGELHELVRVGGSGIEIVYADAIGVELLDGTDGLEWTRELPDERRVAVVPRGRRARLTLGALTLLVSPGERPPAHALAPTLSWREHLVTAVVGLVAALFLFALNAIPPSPSSLSLDDNLVMQRLARFVLHPPVPPPSHDQGTLLASTGGGHTAAPAPRRRTTAPTLTPGTPKKAGSPLATRELATEAANRAGILGIFQGSTQAGSIFGASSAIGANGHAAMGEITGEGSEVATSERGSAAGYWHFEGLAPLVQGGPGGNGTSIAAGPISSHDGTSRIPGRPGLGIRRTTSPIDLATTETHVIGDYDRSIIRRVIHSHMPEFRFCYERELQRDASLSGRVVPRFTLDPNGRVVASMLESSTMKNPTVEACVVQTARRMEFPKAPPGAGLTIVSYPFVFKTAAQN